MKNILIFIISFKAFYKTKLKDFLINIIFNNDLVVTNFLKTREIIRNDTFDFIKLTKIKIIIKYDIKYQISNFIKNIYLKLIKMKKINYYILKKKLLKKLSFIRF